LVVVADGALQYVPFAALPSPSIVTSQLSVTERKTETKKRLTTDNGPRTMDKPLAFDHEVVSLPSVSALAVQRAGLAGRKPAPNGVAVIADPVFSLSDERFKPNLKTTAQPLDQTDANASTRIIEHLADDSGSLVIRRLQFTRQEAERILAVAPGESNLKALDFKANRTTATSGDLSKYRYVHFATHGYLDSERPDLSAVVLSLVDEQGKPQDGFLRAREIYNLNLPAELVVLSACQTGLGKEIKGEGLVGLTRGFMYAGARRVVVSLWNVNDKATAELMQRFYRKMLRDKQSPAASLRAAQVEMWQQRQWHLPYYWAAFVLQGEWK
jgi:CHAT domain-containing protein